MGKLPLISLRIPELSPWEFDHLFGLIRVPRSLCHLNLTPWNSSYSKFSVLSLEHCVESEIIAFSSQNNTRHSKYLTVPRSG